MTLTVKVSGCPTVAGSGLAVCATVGQGGGKEARLAATCSGVSSCARACGTGTSSPTTAMAAKDFELEGQGIFKESVSNHHTASPAVAAGQDI